MEYFLVTLLVIVLFHFVYESLLAPSLRLRLRFDLFVLRDRVRNLKIDNPKEFQDKHFHHLQDSINTLIALLARFDIATLSRIEAEMKSDPALKRRADERSRILDDCQLEEARKIRHQTLRLASVALALNSGGWFVYIVPTLAIVAVWFGLSGYVSSFQGRIKTVIAIPETDINRFAPAGAADMSLGLTG